ncbi:MAG: hypothetical protein CVU00_09505 [Bacteroidetes bacterium HGW-Bacteroidetes-17]|nr:MAG: hypothetical protein CVU00_09505 [Bacteroidetes bacterium HGW-Bacteroidetes-17]
MIKNYFKSAYRNIIRNKFYSFINILGLAIGFMATIIILLYNQNELNYDKHNKKYDRIYRLESHFTIAGKDDLFAITSVPLGPAFKVEYPEVEEFVRLFGDDGMLIEIDENKYYEDRLFWADSTIFNVFTHEFIYGDPMNALTEPNTCVINETLARKYFGNNNPMGEVIKAANEISFKITGVIKDQPDNTHLKYNGLFSIVTLSERIGRERFNSFDPAAFWNINPFTYILLKENSSMESILEKSPLFYEKYMKAVGDQINAGFIPKATPLADIHLNSNLKGDEPTGNKAYVLIFTIVALFILVIAGINYMNMATARSTKRAKEVGLRKVIGAVRSQLMRQFLSESLILALIAFLISLLAVSLILPSFNELAGKNLVFGIETSGIILWTLLISIGVGLLSGSYPSFYLSAFAPIKVLKGKINTGKSKGSLRKILVVFQFIISISMIVGTLVVTKQLNYMRSKDLGFAKDNILVTTIQADTNLLKKMPTFREELLQNPNVKDLSTSNGYPGNIGGIIVMKVEQDTKLGTSDSTASSSGGSQMVEESLNFTMIDYDFLNLYEIKFKDGRNFSREMGTDLQEGVIINEACAKELGWTDNPLGKKIGFGLQLDGTFTRSTKVIGVVKDFNYRSLHNAVEPLALFLTDRPLNAVSIKIGTENRQQTIQFIEDKWNKFGAIHPFDYNFLKDTMDDMYQAEEKIGKVFTIAALLSVFIALLGLLGLSSFIAEQRTKEIGIRKVVGATLESILAFLFKEFVILILIAFVIASPIAWYLLNNWLDSNFVYATNIGLLTFLLAGFIAFVIGILTISFHIYRAASSNPVDALKYE